MAHSTLPPTRLQMLHLRWLSERPGFRLVLASQAMGRVERSDGSSKLGFPLLQTMVSRGWLVRLGKRRRENSVTYDAYALTPQGKAVVNRGRVR